MKRLIIECVGWEKCLHGRGLFLMYSDYSERKFAPQQHFSKFQIKNIIDMHFDLCFDITIIDNGYDLE